MQDPPVTFEGLKTRALGAQGRSFLTNLLKGKKTDFYSAKLMCILGDLMNLSHDDGNEAHLCTRENRLVQILTNLRNCDTGQGGDLQELYNALPSDRKYQVITPLFDWENIDHDKRKAFGFLMAMVGEGAFQVLGEDNPLMRAACGLPENGSDIAGNRLKINELTHQTKYVINFIGRDIGVKHPDSFPHNAALFYENMLSFEKTPFIKIYYDYIWQDKRMLNFFRAKINESVKPFAPIQDAASSSSSAPETQGGFFTALDSLRPADMSPNQMWDMDENDVTTITDEGLVALLLKAGILQENTNVLPWGSMPSASSS